MSLTLIAMTGILVGFLCLVIGFFMEDNKGQQGTDIVQERRGHKQGKKRMVAHRRKAA